MSGRFAVVYFAVVYEGQTGDAAWVFDTLEEALGLQFGGEGWFEVWEAEGEGVFERDPASGALWAPARRRLIKEWSYFDEEYREEDWEDDCEDDWEEDWEN